MTGNNTIILASLLAQFKDEFEIGSFSDSDSFELFSSSQIAKYLGIDFQQAFDSVVDGGNDGGIDSFIIVVDGCFYTALDQLEGLSFTRGSVVKILIVQSKYAPTFKESTLDKLLSSLPVLFDLNISEDELLGRFNPSVVEKTSIFRKCWVEGIRQKSKIEISFFYVTKANEKVTTSVFDGKVQQILGLAKSSVPSVAVDFEILSAKELIEQFNRTVDSIHLLKFKESPIAVSYADGSLGYIGLVSLDEYFKFIVDSNGKIKEDLFESNVRHYQGETDFNSKIRGSLEEKNDVDFWWLNNGVTIIASGLTPLPKEVNLENPQIVNGLQTSFTIGNIQGSEVLGENRTILVKIIVTQSQNTIDRIIAATNSQNPISRALLRATDPVQRTIESFFLTKGYFYDRRKNYYRNLGKPSSKIFTLQATAQAIEAILNCDPGSARSKPTSLIKEDKTYNQIFRVSDNFQSYLNCCHIIKRSQVTINNIQNKDERTVIRNFVYHLARVATSLALNKAAFDRGDVAIWNDLEELNAAFSDELMARALSKFDSVLGDYLIENPSTNIINIAKSKKIGEFITSSLSISLRPKR